MMVYGVQNGISWYISVLVGILQIQKVCINLRIRTQYLAHTNQQTQPLSYERCFLGLNIESRRYMDCFFAHNALFHLLVGVERPAPSPPRQRDIAPHPIPPPVAGGPALDMIAMNVTTATNSVGTMDITAYRAKLMARTHAPSVLIRSFAAVH
jgi:hypothetical protein